MTRRRVLYETLNLLQLLTFLLLLGVVLDLLVGGNADYPCYAVYNWSENCVSAKRKDITPEQARNFRIEAFLTYYSAAFSGGGCLCEGTPSDLLEVKTRVRTIRLERVGTDLKLNGRKLNQGEQFEDHTWLTLDPWTEARIRFENLGLTRVCDDEPGTERVIVTARVGSEYLLWKGGLVVLALLSAFIILTLKLNKLKTESVLGRAAPVGDERTHEAVISGHERVIKRVITILLGMVVLILAVILGIGIFAYLIDLVLH